MLDKLKKKFKKEKEVVSLCILSDKCTNCGVCVKKCKREVFAKDSKKKRAVVANIANCVGCGKCVKKMCKYDAIELVVKKKKKK